MGLTTALNTSLNGLSLNETLIEVIGNNIANAGTNGFKSSNVQFTTQLARTLSVGSAPQGFNGGTNPRQIGLGATTAAIRRDLSQGAITSSTSPSDLAIEGEGFFVVRGGEGQTYTRNGNFTLNNQSKLVNAEGLRVQGYGISDDFTVVKTQLVDIEIPLGKLNVAQSTSEVDIEGALKTGADAVPADGPEDRGIITSDVLTDGVNPITNTTLLSDVQSASGNVFTVGDTVDYTPRKGGANSDAATYTVTATSDVAEFMQFLSDTLGLDTADGIAGVSVTATGQIQVVSNAGTSQEVNVPSGDQLRLTSGTTLSQLAIPFGETQAAVGESAVVTFPVYDSLGEQIVVKMHAVLESKSTSLTTFRYYLESADDSDPNRLLATGTFTLDGNGEVTGDATANFTVNRGNTAATDLGVEIDFSSISGLTELNASSTLNLLTQNGAPPGTLSSFNINESGLINGVFSNGIIRSLGQVVMARFPNPLGLVENGGGTFLEGVSSGPAQIVEPGDQGSGTVRAGSIELSNTDVGRSLVDLIVASTNYRGNARVISSTQQLVDELLVLGR